MFNYIKFSKGFGKNCNFHKEFSEDREFMSHLEKFEENQYIKKYAYPQNRPLREDIRLNRYCCETEYNCDIVANINTSNDDVNIDILIDVKNSKITYMLKNNSYRHLSEIDYFDRQRATTNILYMVKKFVQKCIQKPVEVAEYVTEELKLEYNYNCKIEKNNLVIEQGNLLITFKNFVESIGNNSQLQAEFEKIKGKINLEDTKTFQEINENVKEKLKQIWK